MNTALLAIRERIVAHLVELDTMLANEGGKRTFEEVLADLREELHDLEVLVERRPLPRVETAWGDE